MVADGGGGRTCAEREPWPTDTTWNWADVRTWKMQWSCGYVEEGEAKPRASRRGRIPRLTRRSTFQVQRDTFGTEKASFFAVLDGHGGAAVVEKVKERLVHNVVSSSHFQNGTDMKAAIMEGFRKTDEQVIEDATASQFCGSTAAMVVVVGSRIYLAHIGDTRIVVSCDNGETHVTRDHKANREDEKKRIEELGGTVLFFGTWRVEGMLAVTRSFGDGVLKTLIPADPEVDVRDVPPSNMSVAIIATDGVWDVISNQEAIRTVRGASNPKEAAKTLVQEAFDRGSTDNISAIVVEFNS